MDQLYTFASDKILQNTDTGWPWAVLLCTTATFGATPVKWFLCHDWKNSYVLFCIEISQKILTVENAVFVDNLRYQIWRLDARLCVLTCVCPAGTAASSWWVTWEGCEWRPVWPMAPSCEFAETGSERWARRQWHKCWNCNKNLFLMAVVVAQLVEWSLHTTEIRSSNPVAGKFYLLSNVLKLNLKYED